MHTGSCIVVTFVLCCIFAITNIEANDPTIVFINSLADRGLNELSRILAEKHKETLPLPNIDYSPRKTFPRVRLVMLQGSFGKLNTLKRSGDVFLIMDGNSLSLNMTATIEEAVFHFGKFEGHIGDVVLADELTITVDTNEIHMQTTLLLTNTGFKVNLDAVELTKFRNFHAVRRKNGVEQSDITNAFLTLAFNKYDEKLRILLGKLLKKKINNILLKHDLL